MRIYVCSSYLSEGIVQKDGPNYHPILIDGEKASCRPNFP